MHRHPVAISRSTASQNRSASSLFFSPLRDLDLSAAFKADAEEREGAPDAVEVGTEAQAVVEHDVVPELGIFEDLGQLELVHRGPGDGRGPCRHVNDRREAELRRG